MAGFYSGLRRLYLVIYNWVVFIGWVQVLYFAVNTLRESSPAVVYDVVEKLLQLEQTVAVLEILHGLVGLVRSPILETLPQIGSRLFVTQGILHSFPKVRNHCLISSLVINWSLNEIIRYYFFGMKEAFGYTPSWLQWLRTLYYIHFYYSIVNTS